MYACEACSSRYMFMSLNVKARGQPLMSFLKGQSLWNRVWLFCSSLSSPGWPTRLPRAGATKSCLQHLLFLNLNSRYWTLVSVCIWQAYHELSSPQPHKGFRRVYHGLAPQSWPSSHLFLSSLCTSCGYCALSGAHCWNHVSRWYSGFSCFILSDYASQGFDHFLLG